MGMIMTAIRFPVSPSPGVGWPGSQALCTPAAGSFKIADTMPLLDRVQKDMVLAMKSRDEARLSTLRMMKTALKKHEVDAMKPLDEAAEMQILKSLVKQRTESADMFRFVKRSTSHSPCHRHRRRRRSKTSSRFAWRAILTQFVFAISRSEEHTSELQSLRHLVC